VESELELNHKEDNLEMVKDFLGLPEEKPENTYNQNIKNYFKKKRTNSTQLESKKFLSKTMEDFSNEWKNYFNVFVSENSNLSSLDWNQIDKSFLNNLNTFFFESKIQFMLPHFISIESAINNFIILDSTFSQEELVLVQQNLLDNLISSKTIILF
jgi:hypothetical protein